MAAEKLQIELVPSINGGDDDDDSQLHHDGFGSGATSTAIIPLKNASGSILPSSENVRWGRSRLIHVVSVPSGCRTVVFAAGTGEYAQRRQSAEKAWPILPVSP
eukprot:SAG31_NODE_1426_length_8393_cov_3.363275_3_plen_104_part_00